MRTCKAVSNLGRNGEEAGFSAFRFPALSDPFDEGVVGAYSDDLGELGEANLGQPLRRNRWQAAVRPLLDENLVDVLWPSGEKLPSTSSFCLSAHYFVSTSRPTRFCYSGSSGMTCASVQDVT
jgi:hypothetical protein